VGVGNSDAQDQCCLSLICQRPGCRGTMIFHIPMGTRWLVGDGSRQGPFEPGLVVVG